MTVLFADNQPHYVSKYPHIEMEVVGIDLIESVNEYHLPVIVEDVEIVEVEEIPTIMDGKIQQMGNYGSGEILLYNGIDIGIRLFWFCLESTLHGLVVIVQCVVMVSIGLIAMVLSMLVNSADRWVDDRMDSGRTKPDGDVYINNHIKVKKGRKVHIDNHIEIY